MTVRADRPPRAVIIGIAVFATVVLALFTFIVVSLVREARVECPLCEAVATNDPAKVRVALDDGAPMADAAWEAAVRRVTDSGADASAVEIVRTMLSRGADPNASWFVGGTEARRSAIQPAATRMWASAVLAQSTASDALTAAMITHGLAPRGQAAAEALIAAAISERVPAVRRLIDAGVPPNRVDGEGGPSALARAIQTRNLELIAVLEAAGGREW